MTSYHIEVVVHNSRAHTWKTTIPQTYLITGFLSYFLDPTITTKSLILNSKLTSSGFVHWSARRPLVLMWIIPLDAGQVRHSVVSTHHKYKSKHHTYSEVDPLICHGGYHFPGILARVIPLHAVYSRRSTVIKTQRLKSSNSPKSRPLLAIPSFASSCDFVCLHLETFIHNDQSLQT